MSRNLQYKSFAGLLALACLASHALAAQRPGLNVGTQPGGLDVVYDGIVNADFDDPSDSWTVGPALAAVTFYLSLNDSALDGSPPSQNLAISLEYLNSLVNVTVNVPNPYVSIGWENQLPLELDFQCLETGAAVVGVQLGMAPYGVTTFFFIKECSVAPYRQNFSIATSMTWLTSPDVVVNGKLNSNFSLDVDYGDNTTFQVYLTMLSGGSQFYNVTNIDSDEVVMIPSWNYYPDDQLARDLTNAPPSQLVITYACMLPGISDVVVSIDIPNFRPIEFTFKKGCPVPPTPFTPSKDDGGGLSGGSIAAIVICVLLLSACFAGCAFNRLARKKEGLAVIPGYVSMLNLMHKLRMSSTYHPQTDYESRLATHDTYGTYQSNL